MGIQDARWLAGPAYVRTRDTLSLRESGSFGRYTPDEPDQSASVENATTIANFLSTSADEKAKALFPSDLIYCHNAYISLSANKNLNIDFGNATIKGIDSEQTFDGDDVTASFTITAFPVSDGDVRVIHIASGGVRTEWTAGNQYTLSGAVVTPTSTLATGDSIRCISSANVMTLRSSTVVNNGSLTIRGGIIDLSLRAWEGAGNSGAVGINNWDHVDIQGLRGKTDYANWKEAQAAYKGGDSFVTLLRNNSLYLVNNRFKGGPNGGFYILGVVSADIGNGIERGRSVLIGNHGQGCEYLFSYRLFGEGLYAAGNSAKDQKQGVLVIPHSDELSGQEVSIVYNRFTRMTDEAIRLQVQRSGCNLCGNIVTDFGYEPDGTTPSSIATAFRVYGSRDGHITGNTIGLRDWSKNNQIGIQFASLAVDSTTYLNTNTQAGGNTFRSLATGIAESASTCVGHHYPDNIMDDVTTPYSSVSHANWSYIDAATSARYTGKAALAHEGTWTPVFSFANADGSFGYSTQNGTYRISNGWITGSFSIVGTVTHTSTTTNVRVAGLPVTISGAGENGGGSITRVQGITFGTTVMMTCIPEAGQSRLLFRMIGISGGDRFLQATEISSGTTVRIDGHFSAPIAL